eukprot:snap_masked-scaffold_3-processed-gene-16.49-mRNA-1 protein AED:1.00 eAED:1.00 QI:0/-1/0/0/-1/1/1/0/235
MRQKAISLEVFFSHEDLLEIGERVLKCLDKTGIYSSKLETKEDIALVLYTRPVDYSFLLAKQKNERLILFACIVLALSDSSSFTSHQRKCFQVLFYSWLTLVYKKCKTEREQEDLFHFLLAFRDVSSPARKSISKSFNRSMQFGCLSSTSRSKHKLFQVNEKVPFEVNRTLEDASKYLKKQRVKNKSFKSFHIYLESILKTTSFLEEPHFSTKEKHQAQDGSLRLFVLSLERENF